MLNALQALIDQHPPQEQIWLVYHPADKEAYQQAVKDARPQLPSQTFGFIAKHWGNIPTWETSHQPHGEFAAVPESQMLFYLAKLSREYVAEWVKYRTPIEQRYFEIDLEIRRAIARSQGYVFPEDVESPDIQERDKGNEKS